ncbi:unnamed protein product [Symbiodinium natans]|uniref:Uncharacterized protein n=1 Tax=Symbiodinium natans TaxID=878477 RepID=A0A812PSQ6_9DINO|nr:unnamed protein product [Symbiodinium natans]
MTWHLKALARTPGSSSPSTCTAMPCSSTSFGAPSSPGSTSRPRSRAPSGVRMPAGSS